MTATPTPIRECDQALDYLYSMLEGDDKARFEQHLATCARCQGELASFGSVRKVAQEALATVEPTERLTGALHQQLLHAAAQRKPRGKVLPFLRRVVSHPGYAAAAAFLLVGGAVGVEWTRGRLLMTPPATQSAPAAPAATPVEAKPEVAKADEHEEQKKPGAVGDGEGLIAPSGTVAGKNKDKSLPVVMAEPAKHAAPAVPKKESAAGFDRDEWAKARGPVAGDVAEKRAITAQLKKGRAADNLDDALAGLEAKDAREGAASSSFGVGNGTGGGGYRSAPVEKPSPVARQAQAPAAAPAPQQMPSPKAPAPKAMSANNEPLADAAQLDSAERPRRRAQAAEEAPPPPVAATPSNARGYASNAASDTKSPAPVDQVMSEAKQEAAPGNQLDSERTRAAQLVATGRCEEATAIYARLDKKQGLSDGDRLSYAKCLRVLGRNAPAQQELDVLRNRQSQAGVGTIAPSAIEAEQKALVRATRKADLNASRADQQQRPAHAKAKKRGAAAAMDEAAPAETNVKKVYSY